MSRHPRAVLENVPLHIIQRGNNRSQVFFATSDYQVYLALLAESARPAGCRVHAYVLMTNHVHILASPDAVESPAAMMKSLGERYAQYANRRYGRSGTLWQGRYRSCLVDNESYFLTCQRYIELNPVRANMVSDPADYAWSSYRANALGQDRAGLTAHSIYQGLGKDEVERQANYLALFREAIPESLLEQVRHATNGNAAFGGNMFIEEMGAALVRDLTPQRPGRRPR